MSCIIFFILKHNNNINIIMNEDEISNLSVSSYWKNNPLQIVETETPIQILPNNRII